MFLLPIWLLFSVFGVLCNVGDCGGVEDEADVEGAGLLMPPACVGFSEVGCKEDIFGMAKIPFQMNCQHYCPIPWYFH